jgi:hypothetical protein
MIPEKSGNFESVAKCVHVRYALAPVELQAFRMGKIVGCAHLIPQIATGN